MAPPILEGALLALAFVSAGLYALVGASLRRRRVEGDARLAWRLFTHWWFGLSALTLLQASMSALAKAGVHDEALHLTAFFARPLLLVYALASLLYYLAYLFTGERRALLAVGLFYGAYYALVMFLVALGRPRYDAAAGAVVFREPLLQIAPGLVSLAVFLLIAPFLAGAIAYFRLFFSASDATQRYRIGLVAGTIFTWFAAAAFPYVPLADGTLAGAGWWLPLSRVVGALAGVAVLMAYRPPSWVRGRWGIASIDEPAGPPA